MHLRPITPKTAPKVILTITLTIALSLAAPLAWPHGEDKHDTPPIAHARDTTSAQTSIAPAAADAVATVERFSTALGSGDLAGAASELDPAVLILESGGVERSRDEYLAGHAKHDADFLKSAHVTLERRVAHASGDLAWVGSESGIHARKGEQTLAIASTETMVLRRTDQDWKIVHIHWSSRRADGDR